MAKALLKIRQFHPEVFELVNQLVLDETNRALTSEGELDDRIINLVGSVDANDGVITSLTELAASAADGDNRIVDAYRAMGVEAVASFGELTTRIDRLEDRILNRISYEALGDTSIPGNLPDGVDEPFEESNANFLILDLASHLSAVGITLNTQNQVGDHELDFSQIVMRVILNGEDLAEGTWDGQTNELVGGDFFVDVPECFVVLPDHLEDDDTIVFETALKRVDQGTPDMDFDLGGDLPYGDPEPAEEGPVV